MRAADVAGAWSKQPIESLEDRRLLSAGDLDPSFGDDGLVTTNFDGTARNESSASDVVIDGNGKLVVAGTAYSGGLPGFGLARYNADGSLDSSFGAGGLVITHVGTVAGDSASSVAIDGSGKIVVAGRTKVGSSSDFAVTRYNTDGTLDASFGSAGIVRTDFGSTADDARSVAIDGNGKIVVAGTSSAGAAGVSFALARYNVDGSLDTSFGNGGRQTTKFGTQIASATSMLIDASGKIVVVGYVSGSDSNSAQFVVAKYNTDGTLGGAAIGGKPADFGNAGEFAFSAALDADGKLVVAGWRNGDKQDFVIARYQTNLVLDTSFDIDGRVTTDFAGRDDLGYAVTVDQNGKILVAGRVDIPSQDSDVFGLVRYNPDGSLDLEFGSNGKVVTDVAPGEDVPRAIAIDANQNIVLVGSNSTGNGHDFAVARYSGSGGPILSVTATALDVAKPEGNSGTTDFRFVVTRTADLSRPATVNYFVNGEGFPEADHHEFGGTKPSGTIQFATGETSKTITLNVSGDTQVEFDEPFTLRLADSFGLSLGQASATILDDDAVDLIYEVSDDTVLTAVVLADSRHLQVTLGSVVQPDVDPDTVRSLTIIGGGGNDTIDLSKFALNYYKHLKSVIVIGGAGNDAIDLSGLVSNSWGYIESVVLTGGAGNDTIIGSGLSDTVSGGAGDDSLSGGGGTDRLVEEISAPTDPAIVSVVKVARTDIKTKYTMSGLGTDTIADIEEMSLAGSAGKDKIDVKKFRGSVTLSGNGGNDTLIGGVGNDSLDGGEGNDKLTGNGGTNQLAGGNGTDYVLEAGATNFVLTPNQLTGLGTDLLNSVERASLTTADTSSRIDASAFLGVTILTGGSGNDTLIGGMGKDSISGGAGNDTLIGGNATDTLDGGTGDDALTGQNGHDLLFGSDGQDTLIGGAGRDTLTGGLDDDLLIGGIGMDSLDGEAGNDTGLSGQGGAARGGNGLPGTSDSLINIEVIDEEWATVFVWE